MLKIQALFANSWSLESFLIFLHLKLFVQKKAPLRIYQANWFHKRVTIVLDMMRSIQLRHIFVSDCCNLGRRKWKGVVFFFFLNNLVSCCMLIDLLFRITENHIFSSNAYLTKCLSRTEYCEIFSVVFLCSS